MDRSWLILIVLLTVFFAARLSGRPVRGLSSSDLALGLIASAGFFLSVFLHEAGHSLAALRYGLPVKAIRFFSFGGLTDLGKRPESPVQELWIALSGPVVSAVLGGLLLAAAMGDLPLAGWLLREVRLLGRLNLLLAAFNLIPIFPLDGGRALRALLWKSTGDYDRATRQAHSCARMFVSIMMLAGAARLLFADFLTGTVILVIAWRLHGMLAANGRDPAERMEFTRAH
jgi:Zn-dependent protease